MTMTMMAEMTETKPTQPIAETLLRVWMLAREKVMMAAWRTWLIEVSIERR